ncbi:DsbA family oxidoreductase [Williamsia sp. 1135]|uniref:DsbA family oxidoreductase n=1 Tax=Williamsia sp. 1135 TaxID=1889262 RepID=UPI000A0F7439|nr:DsbA family oxidoreductase [Williamsia sp. 1135]ORM26956.1 disulfide bond formation protein DsbA [Williamsia sp. 1135]
MSAPITVDIWSDIACPWCYIGKRKFEAGLAEFEGRDDVEVTYHSYELAPDTPVDYAGTSVDFLVKHKGMPAAQVEQMLGQVTGIAAEVGLDYDFDSVLQTKTLKAHQVLHYAKQQGKQLDYVERLFKAYFEQGKHVGRDEELADLAAEVGLDRDAVLAALDSGEFADAVDADIEQARAYGISGVPFFVINGKYGVSGAQAPEAFTGVLEKVRAEETSDV